VIDKGFFGGAEGTNFARQANDLVNYALGNLDRMHADMSPRNLDANGSLWIANAKKMLLSQRLVV
jgi:hypothetical protein